MTIKLIKISLILFLISIVACKTTSVKSDIKAADKLVKNNKIEEAIILYQKAIQKNPNEPVFYLNQAKLLADQKKYPHAIRNYEVVKKLNPESFWPYLGLGRVYTLQQQYEQAKDILKEGLKELPKHPSLLFQLGKTYYQSGNGSQAVIYFDEAIDAKYKDIHKIYYYRGMTFEKLLHNLERARLDYQSYLMTEQSDDKETVQKMLNEIDDSRYDF